MEWLSELYGRSFAFGDFLTIVGFVGAIIAAIFSWISSVSAKKSEKKAAEFYDVSIQYMQAKLDRFEGENTSSNHQNENSQRSEWNLLAEAFNFVCIKMTASTKEVADYLKIDIEQAKNIMLGLSRRDGLVSPTDLSQIPEDANCVWMKK